MKIFHSPLIICLLLILTGACKKEEKDPFADKSNYFTCKIDGVPFETRGKFGCLRRSAYYYQSDTAESDPGYLSAWGQDCQSELGESVGFKIFVLTPGKHFYTVKEDSLIGYYKDFTMRLGESDSAISGWVHFTTLIHHQYDEEGIRTETGKLEGTFQFTLLTREGDTVEITDGRFGFFKIY